MAITYSQYLRLRIDSALTADARHNLLTIDELGALIQTDSLDTLQLRSRSAVTIEPNSAELGGTGVGGTVNIGNSGHTVSDINFFANNLNFATPIGLLDVATGGSKYLRIKYKSDASGLVDTGADRILNVDVNGDDRSLILGGNFSLLSNSLTVTAPIATSWTLPATTGAGGQVLSTDGAGTLSWQSVSGTSLTMSETWLPGDGLTKTVTHGWNTRNIIVQVVDAANNYENVDLQSVTRPTNNTVVLNSTEIPTSSWIILLNSV
jgi:hypothetical protein